MNPLKHPLWYHKSAQLEEVVEHTALLLKPAPGRPSVLASRKEWSNIVQLMPLCYPTTFVSNTPLVFFRRRLGTFKHRLKIPLKLHSVPPAMHPARNSPASWTRWHWWEPATPFESHVLWNVPIKSHRLGHPNQLTELSQRTGRVTTAPCFVKEGTKVDARCWYQ